MATPLSKLWLCLVVALIGCGRPDPPPEEPAARPPVDSEAFGWWSPEARALYRTLYGFASSQAAGGVRDWPTRTGRWDSSACWRKTVHSAVLVAEGGPRALGEAEYCLKTARDQLEYTAVGFSDEWQVVLNLLVNAEHDDSFLLWLYPGPRATSDQILYLGSRTRLYVDDYSFEAAQAPVDPRGAGPAFPEIARFNGSADLLRASLLAGLDVAHAEARRAVNAHEFRWPAMEIHVHRERERPKIRPLTPEEEQELLAKTSAQRDKLATVITAEAEGWYQSLRKLLPPDPLLPRMGEP